MKIYLKKIFRDNSRNLMRKCSYIEQQNRTTGEFSYLRRLGRNPYPHFHIYLEKDSEKGLILNLHLDQKRPSYHASQAHSGEHQGPLVEKEVERIENIFQNIK